MLAGSITKFLEKDSRRIVLHHFCSYLSQPSTQVGEMATNLVAQLLSYNQDLVSYVYDEHVLGGKSATSNALEQLLLFLVRHIPVVYASTVDVCIILDGLDECSDDHQRRILGLLNRFVECIQSGLCCKVLVFSRDTLKLKRLLKKRKSISLNDERGELSHAIRIYVRERMDGVKLELEDYGISDEEFHYAEKSIAEKSDGKQC